MSTVDQILDRWPLRSMCARLNISLPARGKFCSPFRPDNNPSCEVWKETIKDRSTGETYDSIRCYAEIKGLSNSDAIKALAAELPGRGPRPTPTPPHKLVVPILTGEREKCARLAELRKLPEQAIQAAVVSLGVVGFGKSCGHDCWIITDRHGRVAESRRLDGKEFEAYGEHGERKVHTIKGSSKKWPVGLTPKYRPLADMPVVLGEGSPDYLALCAVALETKPEFLPVVMLGSSFAIDAQALPGFAGRAVTILAHPDAAGQTAAVRWARQLDPVAASLRVLQLDGGDVNDLVSKMGAAEFSKEILQ
ncbi:MAG: hypothetical protein WCO94_11155 [Verrucomicrobiota bacterium]